MTKEAVPLQMTNMRPSRIQIVSYFPNTKTSIRYVKVRTLAKVVWVGPRPVENSVVGLPHPKP